MECMYYVVNNDKILRCNVRSGKATTVVIGSQKYPCHIVAFAVRSCNRIVSVFRRFGIWTEGAPYCPVHASYSRRRRGLRSSRTPSRHENRHSGWGWATRASAWETLARMKRKASRPAREHEDDARVLYRGFTRHCGGRRPSSRAWGPGTPVSPPGRGLILTATERLFTGPGGLWEPRRVSDRPT